MELRHFRYFIAVAEEENYRRASARLAISQSAVSRQIWALEQELGVQLFDRLPNKRVRLTRAGAAFLHDVREIVTSIEHARERAQRTMQGLDGDLHIAFNEMATRNNFFRDCVSQFRKEVPNVNLKLTAMQSDKQIEAIRSHEVDVGFLALRERWQASYGFLRCEILHSERMVLALPAAHRLASKKTIYMKDLADLPFVYFPRTYSPIMHDEMIGECQRKGFSPKIVQSVGGELNILGLVSTGIGIAFVSSSAASRERVGLEFREVKDLQWSLTMGVASSALNGSPQLARFLAFISQQLRSQARSHDEGHGGS